MESKKKANTRQKEKLRQAKALKTAQQTNTCSPQLSNQHGLSASTPSVPEVRPRVLQAELEAETSWVNDSWRETSEVRDSPEAEERSLPLFEQDYSTPPRIPEAIVNPDPGHVQSVENTESDQDDIVHSEAESEDSDTELMAPQAVRDAQVAADRHKAAFDVALASYDRAKSARTPHHRTQVPWRREAGRATRRGAAVGRRRGDRGRAARAVGRC